MTTSSLKTNVLLPASSLPGRRPLLSKAGWSAFLLALIAKIMCYAICALAMDLIWGYAGILSLGHGLFLSLIHI